MGFSKPKAIATPVAPPPISASAPEVAAAEDEERLKQMRRQGYDWTMGPGKMRKTLLAPGGEVKKRVLG